MDKLTLLKLKMFTLQKTQCREWKDRPYVQSLCGIKD